jgi:putative nucleotidyltransferase with HDIG domain
MAAAAAAEQEGDARVLAHSLRRAGVVCHRRQDGAQARALCTRSRDVAQSHGDGVVAAEAMNALAGFALEGGDFAAARELFGQALALGGSDGILRGRIEQNLGIVANIQGDLPAAQAHYVRALNAWRALGDKRGIATAYNNLGLVSADRGLWDEADRYYRLGLRAVEAIGDVQLRALAMMNRCEVFLARGQLAEAHANASAALPVFDQLGAKRHVSEAVRILGVVSRESGALADAESRLTAAVALAAEAGSMLEEAEAARELAVLLQRLDRNQDALKQLGTAHSLFQRLDARRDMVDVNGKMADLEGTYLKVVREWGQSIESADSYTHGHCERVAEYAVGVARALGLGDAEMTTIRLGAYLHDVGKVKVPLEILNKPGKLTDAEYAVMQQHPEFGIELLDGIAFPWDIKPIVRWHHERHDGTGYPDRLAGDAIPLNAQIICVADVWDALTTTRSYRPAMPRARAMAIMHEEAPRYWRPDVFAAFLASTEG